MFRFFSIATARVTPGQLEDCDHRIFPRVDYLELKKERNIDFMDYAVYDRSRFGGIFHRLETQLRSDLYLALAGYLASRRYDLTFAWSERAGIPFAGFQRLNPGGRKFVPMFQSWSDRQEKTISRMNLIPAMDQIVVHCSSMKDHFVRKLGAPEEKVTVINYSVDQRFFSLSSHIEPEKGFILTLGEIRSRDYATLFRAVEGLPVKVFAAASGSWYAREKHTQVKSPVPENVTLSGKVPLDELRRLYAQSQFVVLPLYNQVWSAGATASLESMCMGKAVVAFYSEGIRDYVIDGETGILVEPGNDEAMRSAISYLMENPKEARRLGQNGRQRIEEELNLDRYVERISQTLYDTVQRG